MFLKGGRCSCFTQESYLLEGHQGRTGSHVPGLGALVNPSFGIRIDGSLFDVRSLAGGIGTHEGRFGTELNLCGWWRAREPRRTGW